MLLFQAAAIAVSPLGVSAEGWSVILDDSGVLSDGNGFDFVLDLVSELELCPAFPVARSELLKTGTKKISETEHISPQRPQVIVLLFSHLTFITEITSIINKMYYKILTSSKSK